MRFLLSEVAAAVGGDLFSPEATTEDLVLDGATIDSRSAGDGDLFVALVAERDGHEFVGAAFGNGAAAALVSDANALVGRPGVVVGDTAAALLRLGSAARDRLEPPVVGITGSVGKTSTKDLVAAACAVAVPTHASPASFNNELGLPLTLLNAPDDTKITVLEMGARGPGHVADLCRVGRPTIGVVTRVALAHSEFFGSIDGVAQAKSELIEALPTDGVAVLNADDHRVAAMAERTEARVITFGRADGSSAGSPDVAVADVMLDDLLRPTFTLHTPSGQRTVSLSARGEHMALNAAAAVATALGAGVGLDDAVTGVGQGVPSPSRMMVDQLSSGAILIDDAYNANPTSVRAGLDALLALDVAGRTAVLGVMAELGEDSDRHHREIAEACAGASVKVIAVAAPAYGPTAIHVASADDVPALLDLGEGQGVLVKGSLVAGLQALARRLRAE